jgi:hypothetical protein
LHLLAEKPFSLDLRIGYDYAHGSEAHLMSGLQRGSPLVGAVARLAYMLEVGDVMWELEQGDLQSVREVVYTDASCDRIADSNHSGDASYRVGIGGVYVPADPLRVDLVEYFTLSFTSNYGGIAVWEALAVSVAHKIWWSNLSKKSITFAVDNQSVVWAMTNGRSRNVKLLNIVSNFSISCQRTSTKPWLSWISTSRNSADLPSRISKAGPESFVGATNIDPTGEETWDYVLETVDIANAFVQPEILTYVDDVFFGAPGDIRVYWNGASSQTPTRRRLNQEG